MGKRRNGPSRIRAFLLAVACVAGACADVVTCGGTYPQHLQGVATDGDTLYWSFTDRLVKTDGSGVVQRAVNVPEHHGDLCCVDGTLYVAVNRGVFNLETGAVSQVWAYDPATLTVRKTWNLPELVHGAGGITSAGGNFYVVGGLPTNHVVNTVYRYSSDFTFVSSNVLATGYTALGIQTIDYAGGLFRMGVYGTATGANGRTLLAPRALDSFFWSAADTGMGVLAWRGKLWRGEQTGSTGRICTDERLGTLQSGVPSVAGVTLAQHGRDRRVTVNYTLFNTPAIVTVDFLTNGVSIGERNFAGVWGDVNRRVETDGVHTLHWRPDREWSGRLADLTAHVTAWAPADPPDYQVVGLEASRDVRWYVSTNALPDGGLANDLYRTRRLVMRRIPAKGVTWRMGAPADEPGVTSMQGVTTDTRAQETPHLVTLTNDYYMAIYPFTQRQYISTVGWGVSNPSQFNAAQYPDPKWDQRPVENIRYDQVRGTAWPVGGHTNVAAGTIIAKLRALTGLALDLPTEAQWEYACRAGTGTGYANGKQLKYMNETGNLAEIGWHFKDGGTYTKPVGQLLPNAWGLYDMHGNVFEFCLDRCDKNNMAMAATAVTEPEGPAAGDQRIMRGGCFESPAYQCRSAYRKACDDNTGSNARGFRPMSPLASGGGHDTVKYVAHRGEEGLAPEGSVPAYRLAVEDGLDIMKLDLDCTSDGEVVMIHDDTLERTMGWNVRARDVTYAEILQHEFLPVGGYVHEKIVRFEEALAIAKQLPEIWIDFKFFSADFAEVVVAKLRAAGIDFSRVMLATFTRDALVYFRDHYPEIRRVGHIWLTRSGSGFWTEHAGAVADIAAFEASVLAYRDELQLYGVNLPQVQTFPQVVPVPDADRAIQPDLIHRLQAAGLWVSMWYIDDRAAADFYRAAGVDALVTSWADAIRPQ